MDQSAAPALPNLRFLLVCGLVGLVLSCSPSAPPASTLRADRETVAGDKDSAQVTVPAGAVDREVPITIAPTPGEGRVDPAAKLVGRVWNFRVDNQDHYSFKKPVKLSVPIDRSLAGADGAVSLSRWDGKRWRKVRGSRVDGDRVGAEVDHFSEYAPTKETPGAPGPALPGLSSANPWAKVDAWYGRVDIDIQGTWGHRSAVGHSDWNVSRRASIRFRAPGISLRVPGLTKFDWSPLPMNPAPEDKTTGNVAIHDAGYITDDDYDRNGNVFSRKSVTGGGAPRGMSAARVTIDVNEGTYTLTGNESDCGTATVKSWTEPQPKKTDTMTEERVSISYRTGKQKLPDDVGDLSGTLPINPQDLTASIHPGLGTVNGKQVRGTLRWTLSPVPIELRAKITAPFTVRRGDAVTLDSSESVGDLLERRWKITFLEGCPVRPADLKDPAAKSLTFTALWDFKAELRVTDRKGRMDRTEQRVEVLARSGVDWETKWDSRKADPVPWSMFAASREIRASAALRESPHHDAWVAAADARPSPDAIHIGVNHCSHHDPEITTSHYIHRAGDPRTWKDVGYDIVMVRDEGPFNGAYFIKSQKLEIDRLERVNKLLEDTSSELYVENAKHRNVDAVKKLLAQVRAHEKQHGLLMKEELLRLRKEGQDPAARIESVVGESAADVTKVADERIWEQEPKIGSAASEENVKARLAKEFPNPLTVWLPTAVWDPTPSTDPAAPQRRIWVDHHFGPAWKIGDQ